MAFLGKIAKKGIMVGVVTKGPKILRKKQFQGLVVKMRYPFRYLYT